MVYVQGDEYRSIRTESNAIHITVIFADFIYCS